MKKASRFIAERIVAERIVMAAFTVAEFIMTVFMAAVIAWWPGLSFAEMSTQEKQILHSGELVTLKIITKDKELRFYVLGTEKLKLQFNDIQMSGIIKTLKGEKSLQFERRNDYFSVPYVPMEKPEGDLKLQLKLSPSKTEKIELKLK